MQINTDAKKIKRWREDRGWSQDHLAEAADLSLRTVQRIENGEGASRDSVMALAAAFNVDVISLTVDARTEAKAVAQRKRSIVPAIWWGVGVAGFGLATVIVEVTSHYQEKADSAN